MDIFSFFETPVVLCACLLDSQLGSFLKLSLYRFALAILSTSSFFLMAKELELSLAQFMISSARHSAADLMFLKALFLAPWVIREIAWLTLLRGETSTACLLTVPPEPILVESSLAPPFLTASTRTCTGFLSVSR